MSRFAESAVTSVFSKIQHGHLTVVTSGQTYHFPSQDTPLVNDLPDLHAELRVVSDTFWVRLCTMNDLGFSEAFMYGDVECDDLIPVFLIFIHNKENMQDLDSRLSWLFTLPQRLTSYRFLNSLSNSRSNISAHYDLSNAMFSAFLSSDMTYSCGIYSDLDGDITASYSPFPDQGKFPLSPIVESAPSIEAVLSPATSNATTAVGSRETSPVRSDDQLHVAQLRKLQHIVIKARIMPGQRVLEIGSGWGSLTMHIVEKLPKTQVDTITLSAHQHAWVTRLIEEKGLKERVRVHLMDYREIPEEWEGMFDRVVSVEMVEAVGEENLEDYWRAIDKVLKKKGGAGVIQGITISEARFAAYAKQVDFIRKWFLVMQIFPGGLLPTLTGLITTMTSATSGRLLVDSVCNIGPHYARTLRDWRSRFLANFSQVEEALRKDHPGVFDGEKGAYELAVFKKKWIYYFCYSEVGFTTHLLNDHIIAFTREGNDGMGCDVFE
ncbi:hypothetical protein EWM64_g3096 [Hericium alpestre]|uniref:Cyclopropane-fatty-acyl-phospholipid synthase n=1 Tax=Hericium alpestre TaxID=135208 RepID=A0A4Z0A3L3_9AGAM|nr:hypothetical protein EWM64_g3096 [Hericium alpestre]